jgi:long-subunit fatty acid transport protein
MYFSLGNITFTDVSGTRIRDFNPNEFSVDGAYSLKLSKNLSGGIGLRYIHSNLTGGVAPQGSEPTHPGNAFAADISAFWTKKLNTENKPGNFSLGLDISNLGTKISYSNDTYQEFLPANLRIGAAYSVELDDYNSITLTLDVNKLLVPTPPVLDSTGTVIIAGMDPNVSQITGMFQSFHDAPGGFTEEIHELMYSAGMEYWYNKQFAVRLGYFDEHKTKGNRKYFSMGIGVKLNVLALDFAYLVPSAGRQNPLANTLRFTIGFNFEALKKGK